MKIFKTIKSSIFDPVFYSSIKDSTTKSAFVYYTKLNLIIAIIVTALISINIIPVILNFTSTSNVENLLSVLPKDFEVVIKDGVAISNNTYIVPIPDNDLYKESNLKKEFNNLLTVDTDGDFSLDKFKNSESMFYLSKDYLVFEDSRGKVEIQSIKDLPDFVINQSSIISFVNKSVPYIYILSMFLPIGFFVVFFIMSFVANLIFVAIMSLLIMFVLKLQKKLISYKDLFRVGLYLVTAVILFDTFISFVLGIHNPFYAGVIIYLLLYYLNTTKVISK